MCCLTGCDSSKPPTGKGSGPSGSDGGGCVDGGDGGTSCACPSVEIQINNTPDTKDDLVGLKCEHPAHRSKVPCRIRGTSGDPIRTIVLTNPDARLRFPESGDTTKTVVLPSDGSWVSFQISGESGSSAIGDAVIEAHCQTATGALKGSKPVTVFWFDQAKIDVTTGGDYAIVGNSYVPVGHGVDYSAQARIRPDGVDCTAPQVSDLRIGIMQNAKAGIRLQINWGNPTIVWELGVAKGTSVTVPATKSLTVNRPVMANDSDSFSNPIYDLPGDPDKTLDPHCLMPPIGCAGGAAATSSDSPAVRTLVKPTLTADAKTGTGLKVGTLTYTLLNVKMDTEFVTWAVLFNKVTKDFCALRERVWTLRVDSAGAGAQHAAPAASDSTPTADPVTSPFSNDVVNDRSNWSNTDVGTTTLPPHP